ncbi:MAG: aminoacyl-tRNA hydrolase [Neisseriaceae bacterium]|nr:aminoacyl-tRNA hydrolase [Neisseriaceae bacterium]
MMNKIQLVVGLGNPGTEYEHTRHNVGFDFVDAIAEQQSVLFSEEKKFFGMLARTKIAGEEIRLLKPQTYMNKSGQSVAAVANFFRIPPEAILVIHDELDLPCGALKLKNGGSHGGHNGLKDIQAHLSTPAFWRLRIGIGHPGDKKLVVDYVLKKPISTQRTMIQESIDKALNELPTIIGGDMATAMRILHTQ